MRRYDAWIEHCWSFSIEAVLRCNLDVKKVPLRPPTEREDQRYLQFAVPAYSVVCTSTYGGPTTSRGGTCTRPLRWFDASS